VIAFGHILCPIDLSDACGRALTCPMAFAVWYEAPLTILHVTPVRLAWRQHGRGLTVR
jgi:nucleotide-binding universal stress UspA family protein